MKKVILLFFLLPSWILGQTPTTDPNWELVFDEEFDSFNPGIWYKEDNFDHYGELAVKLASNVSVDQGKLIVLIKAENPPYHCPNGFYPDFNHCNQDIYVTSTGEIHSFTNFRYGYIEASIRFPHGDLFWPAFWTIRDANFPSINPPDRNANEIDISENNGSKPATSSGTNIHLGYCSNAGPCPENPDENSNCPGIASCLGLDVAIPSYENTYRKFAIEWSPSRIIWYVDDHVVRNIPNPGVWDPINLILGTGLHSAWTTAPLPDWMGVDYVKAYKLRNDCNTVINACSYDFSQHDNKLKKSITIGGSGCSNTVSIGTSVWLRASDFIILNGDFNVPVGATLFADANGECENPIPNYGCGYILNSCNYNFTNYDNEVKNKIKLGGVGCSAVVSTGNNVALKAVENIQLEPGFQAEYGSVTLVEIDPCQ